MLFHYINILFHFFIGFSIGFLLISIGFLLNYLFDRQFPDEHRMFAERIDNLFLNASYNFIYYFSKFQIFYANAKNKLNLFIETNTVLSKIRDEINNIFKKNESKFVIEYVNNGTIYDKPLEKFDFIINNLPIKDTIMRRLFYKKDEIDDSFIESDIKFILLEFKIGENTYKIDLKREHFNYYLVGNKFTKDFFIFYIKNHLHINNKTNIADKCTVKIIDHNVNSYEYVFADNKICIILDKNGYRIQTDPFFIPSLSSRSS